MSSKRTEKAVERYQRMGKTIATRRAIQDCYLIELSKEDFTFKVGDREPWGVQTRVFKTVNTMKYGDQIMKTNKETVRQWIIKVRENGYSVLQKLLQMHRFVCEEGRYAASVHQLV
jgi:hypothetical protein